MHIQTLKSLSHHHDFTSLHHKGEERTSIVLAMTTVTMICEIIAGGMFGSMSLLADGWHMGTHVTAFVITIFTYKYAKKHRNDPAFSFGTGKVSILGGFTSAIILAVVALMMSFESLIRLINPQQIQFSEAIVVAVIGFIVNLVCAFILQDTHVHDHDHKNEDINRHHHHDHNLKAAYFHVLADALTSLLAIIALFSGKLLGWYKLDPLMGMIGALVIIRWSYSLLKETSPALLDSNFESSDNISIRKMIESDSDNRISDLHLWKVGPESYALIISLVTHNPKPVEYYKDLLKNFTQLSHITIEINPCLEESCNNA